MVKIFETDANVSRAKFREIGRIITHWSLLEHLVGMAIAKTIRTDVKTGRAVTGRLSINPRLDALQLVADIDNMPRVKRERMNKLIVKIKYEQQFRNDVAHGLWGVNSNCWHLIRFKTPKQVKLGKATPMTANESKRIANRIETLTGRFETWLDSL